MIKIFEMYNLIRLSVIGLAILIFIILIVIVCFAISSTNNIAEDTDTLRSINEENRSREIKNKYDPIYHLPEQAKNTKHLSKGWYTFTLEVEGVDRKFLYSVSSHSITELQQ